MTGRTRRSPTGTRRHHKVVDRAPRRDADDWARDNMAEIGTLLIGVAAVALGFAYSNPALTRPIPRPGQRQVSVVQAIDSIGPVWFAGFAGVGVFLIVALMLGPRVLTYAHGAAFVLFGMFTAAVWLGWAFSDPRPAIVSPILAVVVTVFNLLLVLVYTGRTARR
jgi:hypothetical protein